MDGAPGKQNVRHSVRNLSLTVPLELLKWLWMPHTPNSRWRHESLLQHASRTPNQGASHGNLQPYPGGLMSHRQHVTEYMYITTTCTFCSSFRASNRSEQSLGATTFLISRCKVGAHTLPHMKKRRALALRFVIFASKCLAGNAWATELPKLARSREHWPWPIWSRSDQIGLSLPSPPRGSVTNLLYCK